MYVRTTYVYVAVQGKIEDHTDNSFQRLIQLFVFSRDFQLYRLSGAATSAESGSITK